MGRSIIHYNGWFFLWSDNSDSLVSEAMDRESMEALLLADAILDAQREMKQRFERAIEKGTSSHLDANAEDTCVEWIHDPEREDDEDYDPPCRPFRDILIEAGVPEKDL